MADDTRKSHLLDLCEAILAHLGCSSVVRENGAVGLRAETSERTSVWFVPVLGDEDSRDVAATFSGRVVVVRDDGRIPVPWHPRADHSISGVDAIRIARERKEPQDLRLGADLLFPMLWNKDGRERLEHVIHAWQTRASRLVSECSRRYRLVKMRMENNSPIEEPVESLRTLVDRAFDGNQTLCAIEVLDEPETVIARLAADHARWLLDHPDSPLRLPVLVHGHRVRAHGLLPAVSDALETCYGLRLAQPILRLALSLGYVHPYVPGIEAWRIADDLDPNSLYFAEFLAVEAMGGSYTIACSREQVFHYLSFRSHSEPEKRTVGDRFHRNSTLTLIDFRREGPPPPINRIGEDWLSSLAARIAQLSQNLISSEEGSRLLELVALRDISLVGFNLERTELAPLIRQIMRRDRSRVSNVRAVEAALLTAGPLDLHEGGQVTFVSGAFRDWLAARALGAALKAGPDSQSDKLRELMQQPGLSCGILDWALSQAGLDDIDLCRRMVVPLLNRCGFFAGGGSTADESNEKRNLLNVLLLCIDRIRQSSEGVKHAQQLLRQISVYEPCMVNLPLGQTYFPEIDLRKWAFKECDLRSSIFVDCDLRSARFHDSFLGGAIFKKCQFDSASSFAGTNLSGSLLWDSTGAGLAGLSELAFQGVNATAADMRDSSLDENFVSRLKSAGVLLVNTAIRSTADAEAVGESAWKFSDFYVLANARSRWGDRFPIITPKSRKLLSSRDAVGSVSGWGDLDPISLAVAMSASDELLVAECPRRGLCIGALGESWNVVGSTPNTDSACASSTPLVFGDGRVWVGRASDDCVEIWEVDNRYGAFTGECLKRQDLPASADRPTSLLWVPANNGDLACLLVGSLQGSVIQLRSKGQRDWEVGEVHGARHAAVVTMAYSADDGILYVADENRLVHGYRFEPGGRALLLFAFQTAHRCIDGLDVQRLTGQLLVSGPHDTAGARSQFFLASGRGDVVAFWTGEHDVPPSKTALADFSSTENSTLDTTLASFQERLLTYHARSDRLYYNPHFENRVKLELRSDEPTATLPQQIHLGGHSRYRIISVDLDMDTGDRVGSGRGHWIEADLDLEEGASTLAITFQPNLPDYVSEAAARVQIAYPCPQSGKPVALNCPVTLVPQRDNNPYVADGRPVEGQKFFGMDEEMTRCRSEIFSNPCGHVLVRAPRRSGKTSFLLNLLRSLRDRDQRTAVYVSGERMSCQADFFGQILKELRAYENISSRLAGVTRWLSPDQGYDMLFRVSQEIRSKILGEPPFLIVLVDEWGIVAEKALRDGALTEFTGRLHDLSAAGVSFCLSSVPGDFQDPTTKSSSGLWRYVNCRIDLGRLRKEELDSLLVNPLRGLSYSIDEEAKREVERLSSAAPDDVNRVMHRAYTRARQEVTDKAADSTVLLHHLDGCDRLLIAKYEAMQGFLMGKLTAENKQWFLDAASEKTPPWDDEPYILIPSAADPDPHQIREVFASAGFRTKDERNPDWWRLWIPRGMTLLFKSLRERSETNA